MAHALDRRNSASHGVPQPVTGGPAGLDPLSPGPSEIRLLVAHGDNLSRAGLKALLDDEPDICIAGSAGDGAGTIAQPRQIGPVVLLVDIEPPGIDAIEVAPKLPADPSVPGVQVVMLGDAEQE